MSDMVNHPSHYQSENGIECIDAIQAALGKEGFKAYLTGNAMKYLYRAGKKWDAQEDIRKSIWYANKLLEVMGE